MLFKAKYQTLVACKRNCSK